MSRSFQAIIRENLPVHPIHNLLTLFVPESVPPAQPGQFFMAEVNRGTDPLLKRPFSLFRKTPEGIQILYRVRGNGTEILRNLGKGAVLEMLGPLGNFYPPPPADKVPLIIAGGIGIASVFSLAEQLAGRAIVFYGARTKDDLLMLKEIGGCAREVIVSTDDGSAGVKGTVTDTLSAFLSERREPAFNYCIYACGPHPLLKALCHGARQLRIRTHVSLEEHMACGIGACLGCVVKTYDGYKRLCKEGPVVNAMEIIW